MSRREIIERLCAEHAVDAVLLTDPADVRWACGFTGTNGWLLAGPRGREFATDGRYAAQAAREVLDSRIHVAGYDLAAALLGPESGRRFERIAIRGDTVAVSHARALETLAPGISWVALDRILAPHRARKEDREVKAVERAQRVTERVFEELLGILRPGLTEREIAAEIVHRQMLHGAERMAFDPIVAAGEHSALPHARPTDRRVEAGDPVLLDFGCIVDGYCSDMTRMVSIGEPPDGFRAIHGIVLDALLAAVERARPGLAASALDAVARELIGSAGHGAGFVHGLGHGVGIEVHEWPAVSHRNDDPLPDGCVVTLEPGVYLEGRFGVRIEDLVRLVGEGCEFITEAPRELVVL